MIDTTSTVVACEIETIHLQSNDAMKRTARTRVVRRVSAEGAFSRNVKKMKREKWSERSCTWWHTHLVRSLVVLSHPVLVYGVYHRDVDEHAHGDAPRRHEQRDAWVFTVVGYADSGG